MSKKNDKKKDLKKKENKKKLKNIDKYVPEEGNDVERLIKITAGVVGVLLVFGLVFAIWHGEIFKNNLKEQESIQDVEIMAGNILNRVETEYYVLMYDFSGDNSEYCNTYYNLYKNKSGATKMYKVNLGSGLNKAYLAKDTSEINTSNMDSFKVVDATLIKVKDGKIAEGHSGKDKVVATQDAMLKQES